MKLWLIVAAVVVLIVFLVYWINRSAPLDALAKCIDESGAKFYGAFWCPHCQATKAMFGRSARFLPYVECSTRDGRSQLSACSEKGVTQYPTWDFADGSREVGELTLEKLASKTGCTLPATSN